MCALVALCCAACGALPGRSADERLVEAAFTLRGADGAASARVITRAHACPPIEIDGKLLPMQLRAAPASVPVRAGGAQADAKAAEFPVLSCEAALPAGAAHASVDGHALALPILTVQRIVIIGDTGCRLKQSDGQFQPCSDNAQWPFAKVAQSAAATRPDLVIHVGDYHYRESPCPAAGCAGSPWGYGYDSWAADFLQPAGPLLAAAPWVFVRGNHETCSRAGQGWFRFFDSGPWSQARSCDTPQGDAGADFSSPYAVPIGGDTQLIVFDSSKSSAKAYAPGDPVFQAYAAQLREVDRLAAQTGHNFFLSHHPVLGLGPDKQGGAKPSMLGLASVMRTLHPQTLFPTAVDLALHGHVHLFEALSFDSGHAATLVLGNSGSASEGALPQQLPTSQLPFADTRVGDYATRSGFGFALLERTDQGWTVTEHDENGVPQLRCDFAQRALHCKAIKLY